MVGHLRPFPANFIRQQGQAHVSCNFGRYGQRVEQLEFAVQRSQVPRVGDAGLVEAGPEFSLVKAYLPARAGQFRCKHGDRYAHDINHEIVFFTAQCQHLLKILHWMTALHGCKYLYFVNCRAVLKQRRYMLIYRVMNLGIRPGLAQTLADWQGEDTIADLLEPDDEDLQTLVRWSILLGHWPA